MKCTVNQLLGRALAECEYLTQIATMADAAEVVTDGPLLRVGNDGSALYVPIDDQYRQHARLAVIG